MAVLHLGKNLHIDHSEIAALSAPTAAAFKLYTRGGATIDVECTSTEDARRVHAEAVAAMQQ